MAFEGLSEKLNAAFKKLRGKGRLTEADVREGMREVRLALLEADVSYKVVKDFVAQVTERCVGADVLDSLTPGQQIVKIVNEELTALMGGSNARLTFASKGPTIVMMVGLQGAGKTTNGAKLAGLMRRQFGKRPLLVACDVYRPAAINQLQVVGKQLDIPVFEMGHSGRSLTAHHSVLIFEVLETATLPEMDEDFEVGENDHELVHELYEIWDNLNQSRMVEAWHDAQQIREEALDLFSHGIVDLKTRAQIERLYWSVTREINQIASGLKHAPDEFRKLDKLLADKYFCNFSLFQSLPDSWAIDQIFPIMPIQRLDEKPDRNATLQDITCDSDGKIANFISTRYVSHDLPVHSLKGKDAYYIGVFLVGAYQEILGDMHNLFGDTNAVHVTVDDKGYSIDQVIDGETVAEVLDYVQYNPKKLVRTLETWVTKSVKEGRISVEEGKEFLSNYRSGLYGYTYLE